MNQEINLRNLAMLQIQNSNIPFIIRANLPDILYILMAPNGYMPTLIMDDEITVEYAIAFCSPNTALEFAENVNTSRLQSGKLPYKFVIEEFASNEFCIIGESTTNCIMNESGKIFLCEEK